MKKFLLLIALVLMSAFFYKLTSAQIEEDRKEYQAGTIKFMAPLDYSPISKIYHEQTIGEYIYSGVFDTFLKDFFEGSGFKYYPLDTKDYVKNIKSAEKNHLDFIIGVYSDSSLYKDFKFIYPSLLDNPVHLVMLPSNINKIKSLKDLKSLKGAISANDQWNDYILEQFKEFKIERIDTPEEMYRQLINGEIDYVFTTYWYGISEIMKLGIKDFVAVSQKGLWNMPLFIAVSNFSPQHTYLVHYITEYLKNPENIEKIKARALEELEEIKTQNQGIVPDSYVLQKNNN